MSLDPNKKYLINTNDGRIYAWTEKLSKKKDLRLYDSEAGVALAVPVDNRVAIEVQGKRFQVDAELAEMLNDMAEKFEELKQFEAKAQEWEAVKERLTTDIEDLSGQLSDEKAKTDLLVADLERMRELVPPQEIPDFVDERSGDEEKTGKRNRNK